MKKKLMMICLALIIVLIPTFALAADVINETEPNSSTSPHAILSKDAEIRGTASYSDEDWYAFKLEKKLDVTFSYAISGNAVPMNTKFELYNINSTTPIINQTVDANNPFSQTVSLPVGIYVLRTLAADSFGGNTYNYVLTIKQNLVAATNITLSKTKATLRKGRTLALKPSVTPSGSTDSITWTSSNKKAVSVDGNGVVKALAAGTATITAKTESGKSAKCVITVPKVTLDDNLYSWKAYVSVGSAKKNSAKITVKNNYSKTMTKVWIHVLPYYKSGKLIKVKNNGPIEKPAYLGTNSSASTTYSLNNAPSNTLGKARACIYKVTYDNGKSYVNPYYKQWLKTYKSHY